MDQPQEYQRLLTADEEIALARRVHGDDPADALRARDELVLHNLRIAFLVAGRLAKSWPRFDYDDLLSEALVALVQVAERYDPDTHHTRFSSFAVPDIRGRVRNYVKSKRKPDKEIRAHPVDPAPPPVERIIVDDEFKTVLEAISKLAPMKAYVIGRRFGLGEPAVSTLREIARDLNCSYEYVRQLEATALGQLSYRSRLQNPNMNI